jgi:hypothetical protein
MERRDHLSEVADGVQQHHDRVVVIRNGHPAAVILTPADLAERRRRSGCSATPPPWPTSGGRTRPTPAGTCSAGRMACASGAGDRSALPLVVAHRRVAVTQRG